MTYSESAETVKTAIGPPVSNSFPLSPEKKLAGKTRNPNNDHRANEESGRLQFEGGKL